MIVQTYCTYKKTLPLSTHHIRSNNHSKQIPKKYLHECSTRTHDHTPAMEQSANPVYRQINSQTSLPNTVFFFQATSNTAIQHSSGCTKPGQNDRIPAASHPVPQNSPIRHGRHIPEANSMLHSREACSHHFFFKKRICARTVLASRRLSSTSTRSLKKSAALQTIPSKQSAMLRVERQFMNSTSPLSSQVNFGGFRLESSLVS
eukprot:TRINITY_DN47664_c0_g1_i1.p1 TRINITY_DN47664_c0_g1~~TRINITY_DN47664_c0_g1_i1.p1  ORF type:complete len:204 (+),score=-9.08 TRINITY_DN47664_c0_g1_i1:299-910(+)